MLLKLKKKELVSRQIHTKKPYRNVDSPLEYVSLFRNTLSAKNLRSSFLNDVENKWYACCNCRFPSRLGISDDSVCLVSRFLRVESMLLLTLCIVALNHFFKTKRRRRSLSLLHVYFWCIKWNCLFVYTRLWNGTLKDCLAYRPSASVHQSHRSSLSLCQ